MGIRKFIYQHMKSGVFHAVALSGLHLYSTLQQLVQDHATVDRDGRVEAVSVRSENEVAIVLVRVKQQTIPRMMTNSKRFSYHTLRGHERS